MGGTQGTVVGGMVVDMLVVTMHGGSVVEVVDTVVPVPLVVEVEDGNGAVVVLPGETVVEVTTEVVVDTVEVVVPGVVEPPHPNDSDSEVKSPLSPGKPANACCADARAWQIDWRMKGSS